jgi:hypothetical protein
VRNRPTGEYDSEILCAECDNYFSPWEKSTANLLLKDPQYLQPIPLDGYVKVKKYDYASVKLCLLGILWKMSISRKDVFQRISLGRYQDEIRNMLLDRNAGPAIKFPILIERYRDRFGWLTMWGAARAKVDGVNFCAFGIPGHRIHVLVDRRPHPCTDLLKVCLKPDEPLYMVVTECKKDRNLETLHETFHTPFAPIYREKRLYLKRRPAILLPNWETAAASPSNRGTGR